MCRKWKHNLELNICVVVFVVLVLDLCSGSVCVSIVRAGFQLGFYREFFPILVFFFPLIFPWWMLGSILLNLVVLCPQLRCFMV